MNSTENSTKTDPNGKSSDKRTAWVKLLAAVIAIEALAVSLGAIYFLMQMFLEKVENVSGAVVIFAITAIIAAGLWVVAVASLKTQRWTRGAILTWQILQIAVATSFLQGIEAWQPVGWALLGLSLSALLLLFLPALAMKGD